MRVHVCVDRRGHTVRTHGDVAETVTVTEHSPGSPLRFGLEYNLLINAREGLPIKTKQTV